MESTNVGIFGSTVTLQWLQRRLKIAFATKSTFGPRFHMERIGCNQGFLSITVRLWFDWQGADACRLPPNLVLKIPSTARLLQGIKCGPHDNVQAQRDRLEMILRVGHASETRFYQLAMSDLRSLGLPIPVCYYAQHFRKSGTQSGILLLADLCDVAAVKPLYDGLSPRALRAVFEQLAQLHAVSLTTGKWTIGADKMLRSTFLEVQRDFVEITRQRIFRTINTLREEFAEEFAVDGSDISLLDQLAAVVDDQLTYHNGELVHKELAMTSVLCHGDLWTNNILWRKYQGSEETIDDLVALIDWQNAHSGNVAEDFVRLLGSSVDPEIRHKELDGLIQFYHECLTRKLREKGVYRTPFTVEQIKFAYERLFGQGLLIMLPSLSGYADEGNGLLGESELGKYEVMQRQAAILRRMRSLIEDFLAIRHKLHLSTVYPVI